MSKLYQQVLLASLVFTTMAADANDPTSTTTKHESATAPMTASQFTVSSLLKRQQPTNYETCGYRDGRSGEFGP